MSLARTIQRSLRRLIRNRQGNTARIVVHYQTGNLEPDPNDESAASGTPADETVELYGLVHFISPAEIIARGYAELRAGDVIIDLLPETSFDGMQNIRFEIDGRDYVQSAVGKDVERYYDTIVEDERMFRTLKLSPTQKAVAEPVG